MLANSYQNGVNPLYLMELCALSNPEVVEGDLEAVRTWISAS